MKLYVGNFPYNITEDDLRETFSGFGEVTEVVVITDRQTGRSKGFGFVEMPDNAEADAAIKALNDSDLRGRKIKVNQARPRSERAPHRPMQ